MFFFVFVFFYSIHINKLRTKWLVTRLKKVWLWAQDKLARGFFTSLERFSEACTLKLNTHLYSTPTFRSCVDLHQVKLFMLLTQPSKWFYLHIVIISLSISLATTFRTVGQSLSFRPVSCYGASWKPWQSWCHIEVLRHNHYSPWPYVWQLWQWSW